MKSVLITLFSLALSVYSQNATGQSTQSSLDNPASSLDAVIEQKMNESGIVGIGAAIIVDNEVVWTKGYGYADKDNKIPFTPTTIMNVGSISKTFTGVALMRAIEQKKLSLDEDINKYLPFKVVNPYFPNEKITLRHLATHTSGITDRAPIYDRAYHYGGDPIETLEAFLKNYFIPGSTSYAKENFLNYKPGSYREYSNIAAALAGYIVELRTDEKLNLYSKKHIFKPLKMDDTGWFLSEINLKNHSRLYDKQTDVLKPVALYSLATYPDGGVRTSVTDLSKFFISLLNEGSYKGTRILKKESVAEMLKFQFPDTFRPENVQPEKLNSGIFWATKQGATQIGHSGSDPGVKAEMLSNLSKDVAVVLISNTTLTTENMLKYYFGIYDALRQYGAQLKEASTTK